MTGLSRCGKRYPTFEAASIAAAARTFKSGQPWAPAGCSSGACPDWHVKLSTRAASRPDPFPPAVAKLLDARDEHCQRCGATGRLERHHRRAKASGGSGARAHTQCACNGVRLCRGCHRWVHEHPAAARDEGFIVRQSVALPGTVPIAVRFSLAPAGTPLGERMWSLDRNPDCTGGWGYQ